MSSLFLISRLPVVPRGVSNPFADSDAEVKENIEKLMGLSVGMTKQQVFDLSGIQIMLRATIGEAFGFTRSAKVETKDPCQQGY